MGFIKALIKGLFPLTRVRLFVSTYSCPLIRAHLFVIYAPGVRDLQAGSVTENDCYMQAFTYMIGLLVNLTKPQPEKNMFFYAY